MISRSVIVASLLSGVLAGDMAVAGPVHLKTEAAQLNNFNKAVLAAARARGLNRGEQVRLWLQLKIHGRRLRTHVAAELYLQGRLPDNWKDGRYDYSEIDWSEFGEWLKDVLPVILEFIKAIVELFGESSVAPDPAPNPPPDDGIIIGQKPLREAVQTLRQATVPKQEILHHYELTAPVLPPVVRYPQPVRHSRKPVL